MITTFIYALCEPGTRTIRYIGKANDVKSRLRQHIHEARGMNGGRTHRERWILSVLAKNKRPDALILAEVSREEWKSEECRFILSARMLGMRLTNASEGGDGNQGHIHSSETRAMISRKGKGRKATEVTRHRMSKAKSGVNHPFFGKKQSDSHRRNNRLGQIRAFNAARCRDLVRQLSEGTQ